MKWQKVCHLHVSRHKSFPIVTEVHAVGAWVLMVSVGKAIMVLQVGDYISQSAYLEHRWHKWTPKTSGICLTVNIRASLWRVWVMVILWRMMVGQWGPSECWHQVTSHQKGNGRQGRRPEKNNGVLQPEYLLWISNQGKGTIYVNLEFFPSRNQILGRQLLCEEVTVIFIRSSEVTTQWNYLLLFSPLSSGNNFGMAAALWERAGRKNVCRASEVEGHLKIIYFKTFIPQTRQLKFREGK